MKRAETGESRQFPKTIRAIIKKTSPRKAELFLNGQHERAADVIESIDKLFLKSLALKEKPLLSQLRTIRKDSTWRPGTQSQNQPGEC